MVKESAEHNRNWPRLVEVNLLCTLIVGVPDVLHWDFRPRPKPKNPTKPSHGLKVGIVLGPLAGLLADGYGLEERRLHRQIVFSAEQMRGLDFVAGWDSGSGMQHREPGVMACSSHLYDAASG